MRGERTSAGQAHGTLPAMRSLYALALAILLVACHGNAPLVEGATIGDTLDAAGTQRVTLVEAEVSVGGAGSRPPPDGSVYASFLFRIESLAPGARYDRFRFSASGADGGRYPYTAGGRQPALESRRILPTGDSAEGWVSFEVPDDFQSLAISYDPPFEPAAESITFLVRAPEAAWTGG